MFMIGVAKFVFLDRLYRCFESCYWHLIEERFCFDKSIAMYEEPIKPEEKNNNMFDNMAFYDSVSVIAGRAVVTIDPLEKKEKPIFLQPQKRLRWFENEPENISDKESSKNVPIISKTKLSDQSATDSTDGTDSDTQEVLMRKKVPNAKDVTITKSVSFHNIPDKTLDDDEISESRSSSSLCESETSNRKKSLRERRMSKSLFLKIDYPKEIPIIRQNSVPKFFMDTPDGNQPDSSLLRNSPSVLKSPMICFNDSNFDLYSVVQIEKCKSQCQIKEPVPVHRENSKLSQIKGKIKLKKSKSTISASNLPHSNYI